MEVPILRIYYW